MNVKRLGLDEISQTFMEPIKIRVETHPAFSLFPIHPQHGCCASSKQLSRFFLLPCLQPVGFC